MRAAGAVEQGVDLAPMTTYKLGGPARWYAEPGGVAELSAALESVAADTPLLVLGRGSNIVFSDTGFDGLVVRLVGSFLVAEVIGDHILAGAGVPLPRLARYAAAQGRAGLEFFVGIPGSVGGAVRMNAGGHGSDTAAVLVDCEILERASVTIRRRRAADLALGYRTSNLTAEDIVLSGRFATTASTTREVEDRLREITRWRREHQPGGTHNAGSIFKNPPNDSAGRIIDALGLKGYRLGTVSVSTMHANFFVADDGALAQDVWNLVWDVRRRVGEATGTWLEPEIRFVGSFEDGPDRWAGPGGEA